MNPKSIMIVILVVLATFAVFFGPRLLSTYGKLKPSADVTDAFDTRRIKEGMTYFASGSNVYPMAVIGINEQWILESQLWRKLSAQEVENMLFNMQEEAMRSQQILHGYEIIDQDGHYVGDWYSVAGLNTVIKKIIDYRVRIDTPTGKQPPGAGRY